MTDLKLQRWLASQLPEEIRFRQGESRRGYETSDAFFWVKGPKDRPNEKVTPREWLHVVSLVEAKLADEQLTKVAVKIFKLPETQSIIGGSATLFRSTWQQRTRALMEVLK